MIEQEAPRDLMQEASELIAVLLTSAKPLKHRRLRP